MENPLSKYFDIEVRADGMYLKVTREKRDQVSIDQLRGVLSEALIVNYDINAIQDVLKRARGVYEKVGPQFQFYNRAFDTFIKVSSTPSIAKLILSSEVIVSGNKPTVDILYYGLLRKGIKFGIKRNVLDQIIKEARYDREISVAEGIVPEDGIDGEVEVVIKLDPDSTPTVDKNGKVDYRNITSFIAVKEGNVLAKRYPPKAGKAGQSVTGEEIPSKVGQDVVLPAGKNTVVSDDNLTLIASKDGIVVKDGNLICVGEMLNIPKNVDFSVGNIKYTGDVIIKGDVCPGFTIEAEGDIEINGEVEASQVISRKGHVTIKKGVIGKNDTLISGASGVHVGFAQDCTIKTDGVLSVEKHLLHCKLICDTFETTKPNSSIIGGSITAYEYIEAMNIGNASAIDTKVYIVDKNIGKAKEKLAELADVKGKILKQLEPVSKELKTKTAMLKMVGANATDRQKMELKKWVDSYNTLAMKIKYVDTKIVEINKEMKSSKNFNGYVRVDGVIFSNVTINMYDMSNKKVDVKMSKKTFRYSGSSIEIEGE